MHQEDPSILSRRDMFGGTCLHSVASTSNLSVVRFLVEEVKLDIEATTSIGDTALMVAAAEKQLEVVQYLVESKANLEATNSSGCTPVIIAAYWDCCDVVRFLTECRANASATSRLNENALHYAAAENRLNTVRYLINETAIDPNTCDSKGRNPLERAREAGHEKVYECLLQHQQRSTWMALERDLAKVKMLYDGILEAIGLTKYTPVVQSEEYGDADGEFNDELRVMQEAAAGNMHLLFPPAEGGLQQRTMLDRLDQPPFRDA